MEFSGEVIINLSVEGRLTITNMAIEAGAKSGIINPDEKTVEYVRERTKKSFKPVKSDEDAEYKDVLEYDLSDLEPQVAVPYSPGNVKPVSEVKGRKIDQVFIGGCTNGRIEDLRIAAKVLEGSDCEVNRLIVIPATSLVWKRAMDEGLFEIFYEAGAVISPPTCGPCLGAHMGVLGRDEVCVSTTNRNFVGRMGHKSSKVYLVSPATAAASAIRGEISDPREII
jgi:3-isopropylmalate/(R)-2-methylmalate dehydratase large subunit